MIKLVKHPYCDSCNCDDWETYSEEIFPDSHRNKIVRCSHFIRCQRIEDMIRQQLKIDNDNNNNINNKNNNIVNNDGKINLFL